jgi:hypothetical protein
LTYITSEPPEAIAESEFHFLKPARSLPGAQPSPPQKPTAGQRNTSSNLWTLPEHDAWFRQQAKKGLDQLDCGEYLTHEEVGVRVDKMFHS